MCSGQPKRAPTLPVLFFFNDTATTEIYTLSLHDALPISIAYSVPRQIPECAPDIRVRSRGIRMSDRKSTRLNSSHQIISYAVFCLKKKKKELDIQINGLISWEEATKYAANIRTGTQTPCR